MNSKEILGQLNDRDGQTTRLLSRSPHPYHRRGASLITINDQDDQNASSRASSSHRVTPRSSSESGTEADDEGVQTLKKLPAPPLRPSKGLRGLSPDHDIDQSPLSTPSIGYDGWRQSRSPRRIAQSDGIKDQEDLERKKIREKYIKRKRGEIARRLTEIALLSCVGFVVCHNSDVQQKLGDWYQELITFISLPAILYILYPIRLRYRALNGRPGRLQIPMAFDPAPLLYPIFIPFLVAASLSPLSSTFLLPNMILGLASIPPSCIPHFEQIFYYSHAQWLLSIVPLVLAQNPLTKTVSTKPLALKAPGNDELDPELLVLLYPLHACLVPTLQFLTTTSLDPSELQLLSSILLDLLCFTTSPQMQILKSLMWIGGVGLFCLCSRVLHWEVALARLPSWRLRRNEQKSLSKQSFLTALDRRVCSRITRTASQTTKNDSSDEMTFQPVRNTRVTSRNFRPPLHVEVNGRPLPGRGQRPREPVSAIENENFEDDKTKITSMQRRHTFSTMTETSISMKTKKNPKGRLKRMMAPSLQPFLAFTPAQALVRKWIYAFYVYLATLVLILGPIRRYVSTKSLNCLDPFGWAIGYLGGNIPALRFWTVNHSLDKWISLPALEEEDSNIGLEFGWVNRWRTRIGEANTRIVLTGYCVCILGTGIGTVLHLSSVVEVDTRRKVFHGIMVAILLPIIFVDPCFIALALALVLAVFLLLDLFRASQVPPISQPLTHFLAPYVDGRDHRGPVIVSHIFLLIGCAIPLWLSMAGAQRTGKGPWNGWELETRDVSMVSGVVCVGLGDAAASLIGRRFGRHKWYWGGGKSLEGSMAFVVAVAFGLVVAYIWATLGGWVSHQQGIFSILFKCVLAASGASLTETVLTGANDNVVVPVILWLLVRGLQIQ